MKFKADSAEWIGEVKSYLTGSSMKIGEIKKILKGVDFENLSYPDRVKLSKMFDPSNEITDELFKKQLDLYFSLLESKSSPMQIPVFSDYIEWVYSQDTSKIPDKMFELMTSRLARSKAQEIPEPVSSFMTRLVKEFDRKLDNLSNSRLSTLVSVLKDIGADYENLPEECKGFVQRMFIACSVKAEIADRNKREIRGMFRDDPKGYYNIFNKAFARFEQYETWIDEPAKKLTLDNMINYANFQDIVVRNCRDRLYFSRFQECARELGLPRFPEYDSADSRFRMFYLREPREYKDYAKRMSGLFEGMVRSEATNAAKQSKAHKLSEQEMFKFATTDKMIRKFTRVHSATTPMEVGLNYADLLIDFVHLDELTGQSKRDIFNAEMLRPVLEDPKPEQVQIDQVYPTAKIVFGEHLTDDDIKRAKELSTELGALYDEYNELCLQGKVDNALVEKILEVEDKLKDILEPPSTVQTNPSQKGE